MTTAATYSPLTQQLLAARGPFASVFYDDSHDTPDAEARLEVTRRDIARELAENGAPQALITSVGEAMTRRTGKEASGRGLIVATSGVAVDEPLFSPPVTSLARVSDIPYLIPLLDYGALHGPYVVVAVDQVGAEFTRFHGKSTSSETVEAGGYPVHKAAAAGLNAWGDQQHRVEEVVRKNLRAVAGHLTHEIDSRPAEFVVLIGQDRARAELAAMLPERVAKLVVQPGVGARHTGVDEAVDSAITRELANRRSSESYRVAEEYRAEAGRESGLAVEGLELVTAALREYAVATLIVGGMTDRTVLAGDDLTVVAPDADTLSNFGVAPTRTLRADEAVPYSALSSGAGLVHAPDDLRLADGIGALLRFALPGY
ncbi:hypothetical protein EV580_0520 [Mycobacterium sp. BK086]|uniref:Rv2629 family ribosome hibernation factor n=1 Tax=Mycobacterium sp. BK086 TaxID=2512165 RepID=UPI0010CE8CFC|nr:hypothetical protein [Mycobacterium sp. BK086]TDO17353.1 hypothetical protein EV580_0520 [Mycobacterium sp. BK086]